MTTVLECGIRITPTDGGMLVEATDQVTPEFQEVTTVEGFSEEVLAEALQTLWEAETQAEDKVPVHRYADKTFDATACYREALHGILDARGVTPEARSLITVVDNAKSLSNTDGFWDDE